MLSLHEDLDMVTLRVGVEHQDGTLNFPPTRQVGLAAGSASFRENKMGISCTIKFEGKKKYVFMHKKAK